MSSSINFTLDTHPMANEISSVSRHVAGTTAAVVAMKAAVVSAEQEAANQVCDNANKGFYALIHSSISQKMAQRQSEVDSHIMKLTQLQKQLYALRSRMERDYNMTSARYNKLFNGLNQNLQQRVFELDRPIINFAVQEMDTISNRHKYLTAVVPLAQTEELATSQRILAAHLKQDGNTALEALQGYLCDSAKQQQLTDNTLIETQANYTDAEISVPVIITEQTIDSYGNSSFETRVPDSNAIQACTKAMKAQAVEQAKQLQWKDSTTNPEIKTEFAKLLNKAELSDRVKDLVAKMFENTNYQTIK